tara:strand:+ start:86 stop:340 length:255 start_codon:yes stop_codon:yes gene_type:complete
MFKNIIIIILVFLLCSLLFQNKENVNLLVKDLADTKELVIDGADYVKKTFEKEFSEVVVESTEDDPFSLEKDLIKEDTFFEEKK